MKMVMELAGQGDRVDDGVTIRPALLAGAATTTGYGKTPGHDGSTPQSSTRFSGPGIAPALPCRLALFGVPPETAEPIIILAELLGWDVASFSPGPAFCPPARLCLAMLPNSHPGETGPVVAWSPNANLNELISRSSMSIMDQPLCIANLETMLTLVSADH